MDAPFQLSVVDPGVGRVVRTLMFLGSVPRAVLAAAQRVRVVAGELSWPSADARVLRKHFGARWRAQLTPDTDASAAPVVGGDSDLFGDLDDFDDIDETSAAQDAAAREEEPRISAEPPAESDLPAGSVEFTASAVFPGDTIAGLKRKVYAATEIPPYRQHLYYVEDGTRRVPYRVLLDGVERPVDVLELASPTAPTAGGIVVDRELEEARDRVRVEAYDEFRLVGGARRAFVADLDALFARNAERLQPALADAFERDLIYFGAVLKFWPELTHLAFGVYVENPADVGGQFPQLHPPLDKTRASVAAEQALVEAVAAAPRDLRFPDRGVAVTAAAIRTRPVSARVVVDLRGVLDGIPASVAIPVIRARLPGAAGRSDLLVTKRHLSAESPSVERALARFFRTKPKLPCVEFVLSRPARRQTPKGRPEFAHAVVYPDGRCVARDTWREDLRLTVANATARLSKTLHGVTSVVNELGAVALPAGGRLESEGKRGEAAELTVSYFWPRILTSGGFRQLKARWRELEAAGVVSVRSLQQSGAFVSHFLRGVVDYDISSGARAAFRGSPPPTGVVNWYAHLSDPMVEQRWTSAFPGRTVRMHHRMTDLRVEVADASQEELDSIRGLLLVFLDSLARGPRRLGPGSLLPAKARAAATRDDGSRLRALQERDPDLFDLKKYDESAKVYSVLCQGDRQPVMVARRDRRPGDTVYWNHTLGRPEIYRCPSRKFPYLGLKPDHPLGRCLPCCRKTPPPAGSKSAADNLACRERHTIDPDESGPSGPGSRHVLAYGKTVGPGRLGRAPPVLTSQLFFGSSPPGHTLYLAGVRQRLPSVPDAGFFFSLAAAVGTSPAEFAEGLALAAESLGPAHGGVGFGSVPLGTFASAAELAAEVAMVFGDGPPVTVSAFSPGGPAHDSWRRVVADLALIRFGAAAVVFETSAAGSEAELVAEPSAVSLLQQPSVRLCVLVDTPSGVYPLTELPRAFAEGRRRSRAKAAAGPAVFVDGDGVVSVVREMLAGAHSASASELAAAVEALGGNRVTAFLVDLRGSCYGLMADTRQGAVFLPAARSALVPADHPTAAVVHGPRPKVSLPAAALDGLLAADVIGAPTSRLVDPAGQTVGFVSGGLRYPHDPTGSPPRRWRGLPPVVQWHDPRDVDVQTFESGGLLAGLPAELEKTAAAERRRNGLFPMFAAEFAVALQDERDTKLRAAIAKAAAESRLGRTASELLALNRDLDRLVGARSADRLALAEIVERARAKRGAGGPAAEFKAGLEATAFEFDRTSLAGLRRMSLAEAVREVADAMAGRVAVVERPSAGTGATHVACSRRTRGDARQEPPCSDGKLQVTRREFAELTEILAAAARDPTRPPFAPVHSPAAWHFVARPGERVTAEIAGAGENPRPAAKLPGEDTEEG